MRKLLSLAFPLLLLSAGCVVRRAASATFSWTFANGQTCSQAGVTSVQIDIPGYVISPAPPNGQFDCVNGGTQSATLLDLNPGTYNYTVTGYDAAGLAAYVTTGMFTVTAAGSDVPVAVDLQAIAVNSNMQLTWNFEVAAHSPVCGTDFDMVEVDVDGDAPTTGQKFPCTSGGAPGVTTADMLPGVHNVIVRAYNSAVPSLTYAQSAPGQITTAAGSTTTAVANLDWQMGGVAFWYNLTVSPTVTCVAPSGATASANFYDATTSSSFYATDTLLTPCQTAVLFVPVTSDVLGIEVFVSAPSHAGWSATTPYVQAPITRAVFGDPNNPVFVPMSGS